MRTTLNISDDVLAAAKSLAAQRNQSVGRVISELARKSLTRPASSHLRGKIPLLPKGADARPVTMELVNGLRDGDLDE